MAGHVLITGVSAGIGAAAVRQLCAAGWQVTACARRQDRLDQLNSELADYHDQLLLQVADVSDEERLNEVVGQGVERFGPFAAVIANAGKGYDGSLVEMSSQDLQQVFAINVHGVHHTVTAALTHAQPDLRIIIVSSIVGLLPLPGMGGYSASKHAVQAYAEVLRCELRGQGAKVTTLNPGTVATEFFDQALQGSGKRWALRPKSTPECRRRSDPHAANPNTKQATPPNSPPAQFTIGTLHRLADARSLAKNEPPRLKED